MQIQLEDYQNGRPIIIKTTNQIANKMQILKSKKQYNQILQLTYTMPNTKQKYIMQANSLMLLKKWKQLSLCCDKGLLLEQLNEYNKNSVGLSDFYNLKGKAVGKMQQYHQKIQLTKKAIQLQPCVPAYHRNLGAGYYKIKQYQKAIQSHNRAIKLEPSNSINYHNKGAAYFRIKNYQQAKKSLQKAVQLDRKQSVSIAWLADTQKQLGQLKQAKLHYQRAFQLTGNQNYKIQIKQLNDKIKPDAKKGFFSRIFG